MSEVSDKDLADRAARGDREAYRGLVEKYQKRVFAIAFEILRSREDAEDVTQEAFVKAYLSLPDFKGQSSFYTWLYRIVYNMSIDVKRKVSRRAGKTLEYDEGSTSENSVESNGGGLSAAVEGPHEAIIRQEQHAHIRQALDTLTEEHRVVITLREVDGLSYEEIAKVTGVTRGTVMSRLHYARKKLQKLLSAFAPQQVRESEPSGSMGEGEVGQLSLASETGMKTSMNAQGPPAKTLTNVRAIRSAHFVTTEPERRTSSQYRN